ncbi:MAG: hypothetical protein RLZZ562_2623 [Planctomycetota bacterium]
MSDLRLSTLALLLFALPIALPTASAQAKQDASPQSSASTTDTKKPLAAWPALQAKDRDRAIVLTGQLKKDDEAVRAAARSEMLAMGAGAAPILFQKVGDAEKELALNEELYLVFDEMLTEEHRALMAEQAKKKKIELRKYLLRRLCLMADPELKSAFEPFRKESDEQTLLYATLGLAARKDKDALMQLLEITRSDWASHVELVSKALPFARSGECALALAERMANNSNEVKAAGLRLLRYVATENEKPIIKTYLAAEDHGVVKEAVNVMRVMNGMEPMEKLSAFDVIGMAKEWQSK